MVRAQVLHSAIYLSELRQRFFLNADLIQEFRSSFWCSFLNRNPSTVNRTALKSTAWFWFTGINPDLPESNEWDQRYNVLFSLKFARD